MRLPRLPKRGTTTRSPLTRRLLAIGGALAVAAGLLASLAPAASAADSMTDLGALIPPVTARSGDVVAGGGKVFVSASNRIIVTDTQGALAGAVTGLSGAAGLALSPDGTHLYAALGGSNQVAEIDTADLAIIRRIDLTAYPCPVNLSLSGSRLWVGYGCWAEAAGGVIGLDLSSPTPEPLRIDASTYGAPQVAAAGDTLVVANTSADPPMEPYPGPIAGPSSLLIYDVSGTAAALRGEIESDTYNGNFPRDLAMTPDGSTVVSVDAVTHQLAAWDTISLAKVHDYAAEPMESLAAVAVSPDGAHVAGGGKGALAMYDISTATMSLSATPSPIGSVRSLAFSGTDVFGVVSGSDKRLRLWRLPGVAIPPSTLTLTGPSKGIAYEEFTMPGRLTLGDGSAPGAQTLTVTVTRVGGTSPAPTPLPDVTTAADGTFTITDTRPPGKVRYEVFWNGSADHRSSRGSRIVSFTLPPSSLTMSGPTAGFVGEPLQFSGLLKAGDQVFPPTTTLTVYRLLSGTEIIPVMELTPAGDGSFSFTDTVTTPGLYVYSVEWEGDSSYQGTWVDHEVTVVRKHR